MQIKDAMHKPIKVGAGESIAEAAKLMDTKNIGCVLVEDDSRIIGIMTERDILRKVVAAGRDYRTTKVKDSWCSRR